MKKADITKEMVEESKIELSIFAMVNGADGATLCDMRGEPDFYDLELRYLAPDGEIVVIEEHENLDCPTAQALAEKIIQEVGHDLCETWEYA